MPKKQRSGDDDVDSFVDEFDKYYNDRSTNASSSEAGAGGEGDGDVDVEEGTLIGSDEDVDEGRMLKSSASQVTVHTLCSHCSNKLETPIMVAPATKQKSAAKQASAVKQSSSVKKTMEPPSSSSSNRSVVQDLKSLAQKKKNERLASSRKPAPSPAVSVPSTPAPSPAVVQQQESISTSSSDEDFLTTELKKRYTLSDGSLDTEGLQTELASLRKKMLALVNLRWGKK